ncbi:hypothetical protein NR402_11990 [Acidithiobacillus ferrooxidans]|uniref:hypothetical protein n=1 Tax=Acidithiobacillus ferrooxidans TaxID=920 RepID=UPI00214CA961|nr:hypothetical protein [Acidithiobacillus ferrooxidans]MCR2830995.1 hypothetical protein [Acidithiobacillus ferrooxidans]
MGIDLGWPELAEEIQDIDDEIDAEFECVPSNGDLLEQALQEDPAYAEKLLEMNKRVLDELAALFHDTEWWFADEDRKITARSASLAQDVLPNHDMDKNPTMAHRPQTRGDSDSSDDHDSHILTYRHHLGALICWTSALEVLAVILPAAQSIKKHTFLVGNYRPDLADYPTNFSPDYDAPTLLLAAQFHGYRGDLEQLYSLLDNVTCRALFQKFARPLICQHLSEVEDGDQVVADVLPVSSDLPDAVEQIAADDLSALARLRDPDGDWYRTATWVAKHVCRAWAADPLHGDDIVQDVITDTYSGVLRKYDPNKGKLVPYAGYWAKSCLRDALVRLKITIPRTMATKRLTLAEQVLARHANAEPAANAPDGVKAVWDHRRLHLEADVAKYKTSIGGRVVVGADSLDSPLSDTDDSASMVDTLRGDAGDMVGSLERTAAITDVHELFTGPVIADLLEKLTIVTKKRMCCGEHPLEFLADVISCNQKALELVKKAIGPSGLAQLARHI